MLNMTGQPQQAPVNPYGQTQQAPMNSGGYGGGYGGRWGGGGFSSAINSVRGGAQPQMPNRGGGLGRVLGSVRGMAPPMAGGQPGMPQPGMAPPMAPQPGMQPPNPGNMANGRVMADALRGQLPGMPREDMALMNASLPSNWGSQQPMQPSASGGEYKRYAGFGGGGPPELPSTYRPEFDATSQPQLLGGR